MTEQKLSLGQSILDSDLVSRIRRNHGLEHATLHVLGRRYPQKPLAGHSDMNGFWIIGDVSTDDLQSAIVEALRRYSEEMGLSMKDSVDRVAEDLGVSRRQVYQQSLKWKEGSEE